MPRSLARTVVAGPPDTIYGRPMAPSMLAWPSTQPGNNLDYTLDIAWFLNDIAPDTIASATVSVAPSGVGDLQPANASFADTAITVWLSGGVNGRLYQVQFAVTTTAGRLYEPTVMLSVGLIWPPAAPGNLLSAPPPWITLPAPETIGFGPPVIVNAGS